MKYSKYLLSSAMLGLFACSNPTEIETDLSSSLDKSESVEISSSLVNNGSSTDKLNLFLTTAKCTITLRVCRTDLIC